MSSTMLALEKNTASRSTTPIGFVPGYCAGLTEQEAPAHVDDRELIVRAQYGDAAAFEELVRNYDQAVLRLALHLTGSEQDAQDIYQEAFLRAYQNLDRFRFESSFYTWIYRIVTNLCLDHLRRRQFRHRHVGVTVSPEGEERDPFDRLADARPGSNPEHGLRGQELRACLASALQELTARERFVFELKHYQGLKLRTVAAMLNTSEGTVKNTLFRATQKLRTALAGLR
jgi:RNA polymerase sigma-70 factor (ECF subfamily)